MSEDQIRDIREDIKALSDKVTELTIAVATTNRTEQVADLDSRIRTLEALEQRRVGGFSVLGLIAGAIGGLLMAVFGAWVSSKVGKP